MISSTVCLSLIAIVRWLGYFDNVKLLMVILPVPQA